MMFKRYSSSKLNSKQDALAKSIATTIIKGQIKVANYLNNRTAHFTKLQKEVLLLTISAVFGAISLYLIFSSIN